MTANELKGKYFVAKEPFRLDFLINYSAPYTGEGSMIAPKGIIISIKYALRKGVFSCDFDDENFIKTVHAEAKKESIGDKLLDGKYAGFNPFISESEFFAHFEEVKK